ASRDRQAANPSARRAVYLGEAVETWWSICPPSISRVSNACSRFRARPAIARPNSIPRPVRRPCTRHMLPQPARPEIRMSRPLLAASLLALTLAACQGQAAPTPPGAADGTDAVAARGHDRAFSAIAARFLDDAQ